MAQIDLKNTTIKIKDGYAGPSQAGGLVNNGAGYMSGATTMVVDGFVGAVAVDDTFTVASESPTLTHKITAHMETLSNTTSITFTPALGDAVIDDSVITILPHELEVKIGEGNLTYEEKRNVTYTRDRGALDTVKLGDEEPIDVKLDFTWEFLKADTGEPPTIEDALKKRGNASTWITSSADDCEPYAVDIEVLNAPPCVNNDEELILLQDFRWESLQHDASKGQVSVSGKCNVTEATVTRL